MTNTKMEQIRYSLETLVQRQRYAVNADVTGDKLPKTGNNVGDRITIVDVSPEVTYVWYNDDWNQVVSEID